MTRHAPAEPMPSVSNIHLLLAYVADLELEVDRLRLVMARVWNT